MSKISEQFWAVEAVVQAVIRDMRQDYEEPEITLENFRDFVSEYPVASWLADFRREGGEAGDDAGEEVGRAVLDAAARILN
jgi:hypothetical protein